MEVAEEKIQQDSTAGSINGDRRSDLNTTIQRSIFWATKEKAVAKKNHGITERFFRNSRLKHLGDVLYYVHHICSSTDDIFQDFCCVNSYGSLEIHPLGDAVSLWILGGEYSTWSIQLVQDLTVCEISGASESQVGKTCKIIKLVL